MFDGFREFDIEVENGLVIHGVIGGEGPPLLLLHGHPQTHVIWHRLAPRLAERYTVIATDLRGYGDSGKPEGDSRHLNYSKRRMALDQVAVMQALGYERFFLCGHDRGGRVAHRLALDHAERVERLMVLDIAPTLAMYEATDLAFATAYWHWFFLIQPRPLPESWIEAAPADYVTRIMGSRHAGLDPFDPQAIAEYQRCLALPGAAHGLCEDYRASRTIDLEHDRSDREAGRHLSVPLKVLWGEFGTIERCFDALAEWRAVSGAGVEGGTLPCGHYLPEEAPDAILHQLIDFMR
ncbi:MULTISPECIES: alpha/beta hydrolase [Chromohalobacter]|uniref:Alpha/beta hydrolase n=1 Tax=Chromohalobacter israelensis (strain ATCC BAA-138 / DSM 3043 / CIP 106854 / NCIMB 13768 / 1H11) TaxID=290398 RepID=Q1QTT6_CHRI1|nr:MULTISPECIES: alpha/beta hydrolase [Chromohalobacter]ABE60122.1 alpha/beta hydrolase [Chromohalobacter salexigens DSM 3043]NQY45089.1 alpha/beta hydrolase [Chromohalobacter sp.]